MGSRQDDDYWESKYAEAHCHEHPDAELGGKDGHLMATHSEHADNIKAAIQAARDDGYKVDFDVIWDRWDPSTIDRIELDVIGKLGDPGYTNIIKDEW